jgi:hypothetical protein
MIMQILHQRAEWQDTCVTLTVKTVRFNPQMRQK